MDISSWIAHRATWSPQKVALRFEDEEISYAQLERTVGRLASGLRERMGVEVGDRIAYLGWNSPAIVALLFACARIGAMFVPFNARLASPELRKIAEDCQPRLLVVGPGFEPVAHDVRADGCVLPLAAATPEGTLGLAWDDLLDEPGLPCESDRPLTEPVLVAYTSGTTGRPKGVVLTQESLLANALNAAFAFELSSNDEVLTVAPMFHVGGLNINTTPALHAGATVTIHERFDPSLVLTEIPRRKITLLVAVPVMMQAMAARPEWDCADLSSMRALLTGSTVVQPQVMQPWFERGVAVTQVYGLTETCPTATVVPLSDARRKAGAVGKPVPYCDVRVVGGDGRQLPQEATGEVVMRGPNVFQEYWRQPQATEQAFTDGWFRSGDVGYVDEDGFLHIVDRLKDVIIVGGSNVFPAELEAVLSACDRIAEAAVIGRADPELGEVPIACVVTREEQRLSEEDVLALFDGQVAEYKRPRDVCFLDALPRNALGKLQKERLRQLL